MAIELPAELWSLIAERCGPRPLAALCRVSKRLRAISEPQLYRCPALALMLKHNQLVEHDDSPSFESFFKALQRYPEKRPLVKSMLIQNSASVVSSRRSQDFRNGVHLLRDDDCVESGLASFYSYGDKLTQPGTWYNALSIGLPSAYISLLIAQLPELQDVEIALVFAGTLFPFLGLALDFRRHHLASERLRRIAINIALAPRDGFTHKLPHILHEYKTLNSVLSIKTLESLGLAVVEEYDFSSTPHSAPVEAVGETPQLEKLTSLRLRDAYVRDVTLCSILSQTPSLSTLEYGCLPNISFPNEAENWRCVFDGEVLRNGLYHVQNTLKTLIITVRPYTPQGWSLIDGRFTIHGDGSLDSVKLGSLAAFTQLHTLEIPWMCLMPDVPPFLFKELPRMNDLLPNSIRSFRCSDCMAEPPATFTFDSHDPEKHELSHSGNFGSFEGHLEHLLIMRHGLLKSFGLVSTWDVWRHYEGLHDAISQTCIRLGILYEPRHETIKGFDPSLG